VSILGCWYISVEGNEMEREKRKSFSLKEVISGKE
jgi:hypothetical protein